MRKQKRFLSAAKWFNLRSSIYVGVLLLLFITAWAGHREVLSMRNAAESAMNALKQQCISFNKLTAADETKSLFRLSDLMLDFASHLRYNPGLLNDEYLERYVDSLRLSGVAVLDGDLKLEASGYTRSFRDANWPTSPDGSHFADIIEHPRKIYTERIAIGEDYYDICAVARTDAPGIIIGFYRQPSGLISDTETDLESMLGGLQLERDGRYIIAENGAVRVSSADLVPGADASETDILQALSKIPKDGKLHLITASGKHYWGYRSGCENYSLYIYYPAFALTSTWLLTAAIFAAAYSVTLLLFILFRNRSLSEKQEELEQANHSLTQTVEMLKALETIYFTLFYVDLDTDRYETIYISSWLKTSIPQKGVYSELKQTFLDTMITPEHREKIDRRMSIGFIRENLNREKLTEVRKSFYTDYQAIRGTQTKWCRVSAAAVDYHEDGSPHHILALLQDVDKEKAQEAAYQAQILKEANEAKIANEAKSEFLRRISHDIRTPINSIRGYIEMGASHPEDAQLQECCREKANKSIDVLLDLVNSVLDMSKLESSEIQLEEKPFDLEALLESVNVVLTPQAAAKKIQYEVLRQEPLPVTHLIGSPRYFSQVITNITGNAVKYSKPGGYVHVHTDFVGRTEDTVTYCFVCEDNGIGMSKEFQAHMYDPFSQEASGARTTYEGVGLGLSIMKKLVDAMGGTVTCESQKDVGTTFRVCMTFKIDKSHQAQAALMQAEGQKTFDGKHVLLVEDNELNMEIAEILLAERGIAVKKAWNGKEAVAEFAASPIGFYNLIFMDIMMPEMNGLDAAKALRALNRSDAKTVPIVAMSANAFQDDVQHSLNAGMNAHLSKPIESALFCKTLGTYLT